MSAESKAIEKRLKLRKRSKSRNIFIIAMLAYPVLHFLIFWVYINSNAIYLTFTRYIWSSGKFVFSAADPFINYKMWINQIASNPTIRNMIKTSLGYFPVTCLISLPLSLIFSYFMFKKVPGSKIYRVIFYLPSILPVAVLTMSFRFAFGNDGFVNPLLKMFSITPPVWWGNSSLTPYMVYLYCIWAGLGFNIVVYSGAMSRVPLELLEYNRLEGVKPFRELFGIITPLIWPTLTTTFIAGMSAVLTVYQQPYFLMMSTSGAYNTGTIYLYIFANYANTLQVPQVASLGLLCSAVWVPFIFLAKWLLNKFVSDVDY
jgi:ABC-type sugar transport system permease subunit